MSTSRPSKPSNPRTPSPCVIDHASSSRVHDVPSTLRGAGGRALPSCGRQVPSARPRYAPPVPRGPLSGARDVAPLALHPVPPGRGPLPTRPPGLSTTAGVPASFERGRLGSPRPPALPSRLRDLPSPGPQHHRQTMMPRSGFLPTRAVLLRPKLPTPSRPLRGLGRQAGRYTRPPGGSGHPAPPAACVLLTSRYRARTRLAFARLVPARSLPAASRPPPLRPPSLLMFAARSAIGGW